MSCRFLLLAFLPSLVFAQEPSQVPPPSAAADSLAEKRARIVGVVVQGNRRTKPEIILREMFTQVGDSLDYLVIWRRDAGNGMFTQVGDSLDPQLVEADRKRIQNLGLFNRVEIQTLALEKGVLLIVNVSESWYFFPFPIIFYSENDVKKLSYGLGVVHLNFRGRAEQLQFSGWLGYNPGLQVGYRNPWIVGNAHLFTTTRFYYVRQRSKSLSDVDERHIGGAWTIGKRYSKRTYVSVTLGYRQVKFDPPVRGETLNPSGNDRLPEIGVNVLYDTRDLYEYPRQGTFLRVFARRVGFGDPNVHYWRYGADVRSFRPLIGGLSFCTRVYGDLSSGHLPIYDRVFFGFGNRLRGYYHETSEGKNLLFGSAELRLPLLPIRYFNLSRKTGFLGPYARNLKFGISMAAFADTGKLWFQFQTMRTWNFLSGYGLSLDLHLPYVELLRLTYAVNDQGRGEALLIAGVSF